MTKQIDLNEIITMNGEKYKATENGFEKVREKPSGIHKFKDVESLIDDNDDIWVKGVVDVFSDKIMFCSIDSYSKLMPRDMISFDNPTNQENNFDFKPVSKCDLKDYDGKDFIMKCRIKKVNGGYEYTIWGDNSLGVYAFDSHELIQFINQ